MMFKTYNSKTIARVFFISGSYGIRRTSRAVLVEIETLADVQYLSQQQKKQAYADAYLFPVNDQTRRVCCEA